jgi:hypothetical protein
MIEHLRSEVLHDGFGLDVEITKHFVRSLTSKQLDNDGIMGTEKCHRSQSTKGLGKHNLGGKPRPVLRTPTANHRMALMSAGFTGIHR